MTIRRSIVVGFLATLFAIAGLPFAHGADVFTIHKVDEAHAAPGPNAPVFILALGSDDRAGLEGARSDAIHLFGINPAQHKATMIDIPRDTYVPIPGHGSDKINASYQFGGPQLVAATVGKLVGVSISYVVTTNFDGFQRMVDELGGLDINVTMPHNDPFSGSKFSVGMHHMVGGEALAFSRNRHLGQGDLTRTEDQGVVILAALSKLRGTGDTGPAATVKALSILMRHTHTDGLSPRDLYRLGRLALSIDAGNVRNVVSPSRLGNVGPASVVFSSAAAPALFADFRDDAILQTH
jgi:LCP family protein required for cell wall assembly